MTSGQRGAAAIEPAEAGTAPGERAPEPTLADVLHDDVLQHLAFARQELLELPGTEAALRSVDAAVAGLRHVLADRALAPAADAGLPPAEEIRSVVAVAAHAGRLAVELDVDADVRWPEAVEEVLRRAVRELVANVVQHAGAATLQVGLRGVPDGAELVVADDGAGIDLGLAAARVRGGHRGLARLRQRVVGLEGELDLRCGEDGGTTVRVHLPA